MEYKCNNVFMIRTPALSIENLNELTELNYSDTGAYLRNHKKVDYLLEAIGLSSPSLMSSINKSILEGKEEDGVNVSVYKYLVRSAARTTPYGLFSCVSLGKFSNDNSQHYNLVRTSDVKKFISADNSWLCKIINLLESDINILNSSKVIWNQCCYNHKKRVFNFSFSDHGNSDNPILQVSHIRYTNLIKVIKRVSRAWISFNDLVDVIQNEYKSVDEGLIRNTLVFLIKEEYLFTDLRLPAYCNDPIDFLINKLSENNITCTIKYNLITLKELFNRYENNGEELQNIIKHMSKMASDKNYVLVNSSCRMLNGELDKSVKDSIEDFVR